MAERTAIQIALLVLLVFLLPRFAQFVSGQLLGGGQGLRTERQVDCKTWETSSELNCEAEKGRALPGRPKPDDETAPCSRRLK